MRVPYFRYPSFSVWSNDDILTNTKIYSPIVDLLKTFQKKINCMFYFFMAKHVFFLFCPLLGEELNQWDVDFIAVYICCTYINIARTCWAYMLRMGEGGPISSPSFLNKLAVFIMRSLPTRPSSSRLPGKNLNNF